MVKLQHTEIVMEINNEEGKKAHAMVFIVASRIEKIIKDATMLEKDLVWEVKFEDNQCECTITLKNDKKEIGRIFPDRFGIAFSEGKVERITKEIIQKLIRLLDANEPEEVKAMRIKARAETEEKRAGNEIKRKLYQRLNEHQPSA